MNNERFDRVRELGARYWQTVVSLIAAGTGVAKVLYDIPDGSLTFQTWMAIVIAVLVIAVIRFPRVAILLTQLILGSPPVLPNPRRIFRGPIPYLSGENLPGRKAEVDDCFLSLQKQSFFVLEGESGCGKSSILNAALLPQAREKFRVAECRIAYDPFRGLLSALLQQAPQETSQFPIPENLENRIAAAISSYANPGEAAPHVHKPVLLCIDQFEELFVTVKDELRIQFLSILSGFIRRGQLRVLICIRNDFRDLLVSLCRTVDPSQEVLNLGAYYQLQPFSEMQAIAILNEMLEPIHANDPLRRQMLDDFARRLVLELLLPPRDRRLCQDDEQTVLPIELQIVGRMIESVGIENFSAEGIRRLGGKTELVRTYVEDAKKYVRRKTGVSGDQALLVLRQLISPARTKRTRTPKAISNDLNIPSSQAQSILDAFAEKFLVNRLPNDQETHVSQETDHGRTENARYELMHEHLVRILVEAPQPILQKARDAEERLEFWTRRTNEISASSDEKHRHGLSALIREQFAQPIPLIESMRLWPFATNRNDRRLLRRNLRGFSIRFGSITIFISLLLCIWILRIRSDAYQIDNIAANAPVDHLAGSESPTEVVEWIKALIYADRANAAIEAVRKIKNANERSKAFAIASIESTKLRDAAMAGAATNESLAIERFSWHPLHSEAVAALVQHLPSGQVDTIRHQLLSKIDDHRHRTQFLSAVSEGLTRAGKNDQGSQFFSEAMATSKLINDIQQRFETLISITTRLIDSQRINDASTALELATYAAQEINTENDKFDALLIIAQTYAKMGKSDKASAALNNALALDPSGWSGTNQEAIAAISEEMTKAGKEQQVLHIARNGKLSHYKAKTLAAIAVGICKVRPNAEYFFVFDEIKDDDDRFNGLVNAARELITKSRMDAARKLLERASLLLPKLDSVHPQNPWTTVAMEMLRAGEIDKATEVARRYEGELSARGFLWMRDRLGPLAQITKKLAEDGQVDKAYAISKDISLEQDMYYALTAVVVGEIKVGNIDKARQIQAEVLAIHNQKPEFSNSEQTVLEYSLIDVAVAFAAANKLEDALSTVREIKEPNVKYRSLEGIAKELVKLGKTNEALDLIDSSDEALRSRSLANLAEWFLSTENGDKISMTLPLITYGDDKSRANAALAKWQARSDSLRLARLTADSCTSASDQLSAYTAILIEYAKRNPEMHRRLNTV